MLHPGLESTGSSKPKQFPLLPNFSASLMFYCTLGAPKTKRVNTVSNTSLTIRLFLEPVNTITI